jgi:hypothetical protein
MKETRLSCLAKPLLRNAGANGKPEERVGVAYPTGYAAFLKKSSFWRSKTTKSLLKPHQ